VLRKGLFLAGSKLLMFKLLDKKAKKSKKARKARKARKAKKSRKARFYRKDRIVFKRKDESLKSLSGKNYMHALKGYRSQYLFGF